MLDNIPENEMENRVDGMNGLYLIDKKWLLVNGYIYIFMEGLEEPMFYWQAWVSVSSDEFQQHYERLMAGQKVVLEGALESVIPYYTKSIGLKATVSISALNEAAEIRITEESDLKEDQSKPITRERVIELMRYINHRELYEEPKKFDTPFSLRLKSELAEVEKKYFKRKKAFAINISSLDAVLFQIINSTMLPSKGKKKSGFVLHLSFDPTFEESLDEIARFRKKDYSKVFQYQDFDGIPTYQLDLGIDIDEVEKMVTLLIEDVFEQDIAIVDVESFQL